MRIEIAIPLLCALAALTLRCLFIIETRELPELAYPIPGLDLDLHWQAARAIRGVVIHDPPFSLMMPSAPLSPLIFAITQTILGESLLLHRLLFAAVGSVTVGFVARITWIVSGSRLACAVAGVLVAALPSMIWADTSLEKSRLETFLLSSVLLVILAQANRWSHRRAFVVGILSALLLACQVNAAIAIATCLLFLTTGPTIPLRRRITIGLAFLAPICLSLAIVSMVRHGTENNIQLFRPVLGIHVRIGYQPDGDGMYKPIRGITASPRGHTFDAHLAAETAEGRILTPVESDRFHLLLALQFIRENPAYSGFLILQKVKLFFSDFEPQGTLFLDYLAPHVPLSRLNPLSWVWAVVLALAGAYSAFRNKLRRELWLLFAGVGAYLFGNILTFITWRYRLPAIIPLAVLAGIGAQFLAGILRNFFLPSPSRRSGIETAVIIALLLAAAAISRRPVDVSTNRRMWQQAESNRGLAESRANWERELTLDVAISENRAAHLQRARLYWLLQRHTESFAAARAALAIEFAGGEACALTLRYLAWLGQIAEAQVVMTRLFSMERDHLWWTWRELSVTEQDWFGRLVLKPEQRGPLGYDILTGHRR